ncbi:MAG: hypothetical protein U0232_26655 [Thermomicrobiales bacterium]
MGTDSLGTAIARITSPRAASGTSTTTTSRTPGCPTNAASTSSGKTLCPPTLIASARRPTREIEAIGIPPRQVAGVQPPIADHLRRRLGIVPK